MPKRKIPEKRPKGMQADGRYRTSVVVGHKPPDENGYRKPIIKYASGRTKAERDAAADELRRIHGAGGPGALADILFEDYARKWLDGRAGEIDSNTSRTYRGYIENDIIPYLGSVQVRSVLPSDCKLAMAKNKELAPGTYNMIVMLIKAIFEQAVEDGICPKSPANVLKRQRDYEQKRRALTESERRAVLEYIDECPGTDAAKALAIFYYTGVRRGEGFGPQWKHIDFKNRKIRICQQLKYKEGGGGEVSPKLKTRNSYRDIPMPQQLYDALHPYAGLPEVYVFQRQGSHYRPCDVEDLWESIKGECPALADISLHYFRHNFATEMYKAGVPVVEAARIFGDTVKEMLETYTHIENELHLNPGSKAYSIFPSVAASLPG